MVRRTRRSGVSAIMCLPSLLRVAAAAGGAGLPAMVAVHLSAVADEASCLSSHVNIARSVRIASTSRSSSSLVLNKAGVTRSTGPDASPCLATTRT